MGTILTFSPEVIQFFDANRQQGKVRTEIGGQLFARITGNEVQVLRITGPNSTDKRGWSWFKPDLRRQNKEIKQIFREGLHFVGDWHTHPEEIPNPSSLDLTSMGDCFVKSRHTLKAFVMVIVGRKVFPDGLWVSLHNEEDFERLTAHRRMIESGDRNIP